MINKNRATSSVNCHINKLYLFCSRQSFLPGIASCPHGSRKEGKRVWFVAFNNDNSSKMYMTHLRRLPSLLISLQKMPKNTTTTKKRKNTTTNPKMISHSKVKKVEETFSLQLVSVFVCVCVCRLGIKCRWRFMAIGSSSPGNGNESWGPAEAKCSN